MQNEMKDIDAEDIDNDFLSGRTTFHKKRKQEKDKAASFKREKNFFIFALLLLPVLDWLVFWLFVNGQSIVLAFQHPRTGGFSWINFSTFWDQLLHPIGENVGMALKNTFIYFGLNVFIMLPISVVISFFIYKRTFGYKAYRIIFYLPAIISGVAMTTCYLRFIDPAGPLGWLMEKIGKPLPPEGLMARSSTATVAIVCYCIWTGFTSNVILFSGAMARIPTEILESAKMEGCGPFREVVSIVFPLIWPTFSTQFIFAMTGIFTASGPILLFTKGAYDTTTISFWIFKQVYGTGSYGGTGNYNLVSAVGLCFTLASMPLILLTRYLMEHVDATEY